MIIKKGEHINWFVRYHEGDLNIEEQEDVRTFLLINPELQADFDLLRDTFLKPDNSSASWSHLFKPEVPADTGKRDLFLGRAVESDLHPDELRALELAVKNDEFLSSQWTLMAACKVKADDLAFPDKRALYWNAKEAAPEFIMEKAAVLEGESIKLQSDTSISYTHKASLKRIVSPAPAQSSNIRLMPVYRIAASVAAAVLFVWMLWPLNQNTGLPINRAGLSEWSREYSTNDENVVIAMPTLAEEVEAGSLEKEEPMFAEVIINRPLIKGLPKRNYQLQLATKYSPKIIPITKPVEQESYAQQELANPIPTVNTNYLSLTDFAKHKINKTLTGSENPEEGLVFATLDQAAMRISEKSGKPVEIELKNSGKKSRDFNIRFGKFGISHTSGASNP